MRFVVALAIMSLVACRSKVEDPQVDFFRGGSRLKARVLVAEGGAKLFLGFHDLALDVDCTPKKTTDGRLRCVPEAGYLDFGDESCTQPVVTSSGCGRGQQYAIDVDHTKCDAVTVYVGSGKSVVRTSYSNAGGTCSSISSTRTVTPAVRFDLEKLAAFDETEVPLGDVTVTVASANDGASTIVRSKITATGQPCMPDSPDAPFSGRPPFACVPDHAWIPGYDFADPACSVPAAHMYVDIACYPGPKHAVTFSHSECDPYAEWFEVEGELSTSYMTSTTMECRADGPATVELPGMLRRVYKVGAKTDVPSFPPIDRIEVGTGSVKVVRYAIGNNAFAQASVPMIDGTSCLDESFADGSRRCIPENTVSLTPSTRTFADAECTKPVFVVVRSSCGDSPAPPYAASSESDGCSSVYSKVHKVGGKFSLPKYWYGSSSGCTEADGSAVDLYEDGGEVSFDVFPKLNETLE